MFNLSSNYSLKMGYNNNNNNNVFFMALSKKSGLFSSRNQGVPWWPTYIWLAKLLMGDRVTSVRVPL